MGASGKPARLNEGDEPTQREVTADAGDDEADERRQQVKRSEPIAQLKIAAPAMAGIEIGNGAPMKGAHPEQKPARSLRWREIPA